MTEAGLEPLKAWKVLPSNLWSDSSMSSGEGDFRPRIEHPAPAERPVQHRQKRGQRGGDGGHGFGSPASIPHRVGLMVPRKPLVVAFDSTRSWAPGHRFASLPSL